jgi:cell division protein FtsZ
VQDEVGANASIIWGTGFDERLGSRVCVTIIATGFEASHILENQPVRPSAKGSKYAIDADGRVVVGLSGQNGPQGNNAMPYGDPYVNQRYAQEQQRPARPAEPRLRRLAKPTVRQVLPPCCAKARCEV